MTAITTTGTTKARYNVALKALRAEGVKVRSNVRQCCRGCITPDQLGLTDETVKSTPYAYTYGGQGQAVSWDSNGEPKRLREAYSWGEPRTIESAMFSHGNGAGPKVAEAFEAQGFGVIWDGSDFKCVEVLLPWEAK